MKNYIISGLLFLIFFSTVQAQIDTVFLIGNARNYGDSIVLRWNGKNYQSFLEINSGSVMVEKKRGLEAEWKLLSELKPKPIESWQISKVNPNKQIILAAASIQQMQAISKTPVASIEDGMTSDQDLNYLWMNASLSADLNTVAADFCNLRFADKNPERGETMLYRIYIKNTANISDTLFFMIGEELFEPETLQRPDAVEKEKVVEIFWKSDKKYAAYFIEKSEKNKNKFEQLNRAPMVIPVGQGETPMLFFSDSVVNYQLGEYRVYAVDMYGNRSKFSPILIACGRDKTAPPIPTGFDVRENTDQTLVLSWKNIGTKNGELGAAIGIKHSDEDPYEPVTKALLPITQNKFIFKPILEKTDYYFLLQVFDTAGNSSFTEAFYQLNDNTTPAKPEGLKAIVNKKGVVTLTWNWNKEKDLDGYLIYFSNSEKNEFGGIVNIPFYDTVFYDTLSLKMLNREVFYKIVAVDKRFNISENSEIVKVLRPDTLPPVSPVIKAYSVADSVFIIQWIRSSSIDVERHYLYRKSRKTGKLIATSLNTKDSIYRDRNFVPKEEYEYYITAVDATNNVSPNSNSVVLKSYVNYYKPAVKIFTVQYDSFLRSVKLGWDYSMENISKIIIYKGKEFDKIGRMPLDVSLKQSFIYDSKVVLNETYFYAIKVYFKDDTETQMSSPLGVLVK